MPSTEASTHITGFERKRAGTHALTPAGDPVNRISPTTETGAGLNGGNQTRPRPSHLRSIAVPDAPSPVDCRVKRNCGGPCGKTRLGVTIHAPPHPVGKASWLLAGEKRSIPIPFCPAALQIARATSLPTVYEFTDARGSAGIDFRPFLSPPTQLYFRLVQALRSMVESKSGRERRIKAAHYAC